MDPKLFLIAQIVLLVLAVLSVLFSLLGHTNSIVEFNNGMSVENIGLWRKCNNGNDHCKSLGWSSDEDYDEPHHPTPQDAKDFMNDFNHGNNNDFNHGNNYNGFNHGNNFNGFNHGNNFDNFNHGNNFDDVNHGGTQFRMSPSHIKPTHSLHSEIENYRVSRMSREEKDYALITPARIFLMLANTMGLVMCAVFIVSFCNCRKKRRMVTAVATVFAVIFCVLFLIACALVARAVADDTFVGYYFDAFGWTYSILWVGWAFSLLIPVLGFFLFLTDPEKSVTQGTAPVVYPSQPVGTQKQDNADRINTETNQQDMSPQTGDDVDPQQTESTAGVDPQAKQTLTHPEEQAALEPTRESSEPDAVGNDFNADKDDEKDEVQRNSTSAIPT